MRRVFWSFLLVVVVTVRCQERITIFTSSDTPLLERWSKKSKIHRERWRENEIDYEKPSDKPQTAQTIIGKHSSKPLSIELAKSTNPSQDRTIKPASKNYEIIYDKDGVEIDQPKLSDKRSSNNNEDGEIKQVQNKEENTKSIDDNNEDKHREAKKLDTSSDLKHNSPEGVEKSSKSPGMVCPEKELPRPLFAPGCTKAKDCIDYGTDMLCCDRQCVRGVKPPRIKTQHDPIFFGMIHRKCPSDPLPELSEVKQCKSDSDCFPRICCTEALQNGDTASYCRTPEPLWDNLPIPNQVLDPLKTLVAYMQCTPPPPPIFDLFPKPCQNPLDCFPNLCCQERGKRYCRPPKKSILALVAELGTRLIPEDTAKKFIERISR